MPYVNKPRPYKKEYKQYHGTELQKKRRAKRNAARAKLKVAGVDVAGKDVDHKKPLSKGGSNARSNLKAKKPRANRSFERNPDRSVK